MNKMKLVSTIASVLVISDLLVACNGGGANSTMSGNSAPDINGTPAGFVQATRSYEFKPEASDADGDTLQYSVTNLPAWAVFDNETGEISGKPVEKDIGEYDNVIVGVSDGKETVELAPFSIEVLNPPLSRKSIGTNNATVVPIDNGFDATGSVSITSGDNTTVLDDANLHFEFDAGDNLTNITGTALLPAAISNYLQIENPLNVKVGLYTGAEINQDPDIGVGSVGGIRLIDDRYYLVFYIGADLGVTFHDKSNPNMVPITLGIGEAQSMIIMDPTDSFTYQFGYLNGEGYGKGQSDHGLIPFVPHFVDETDAFPKLDSFFGQKVEKKVIPVSFKVFDLFSLTGTMVTHTPTFDEVNWMDPLNSTLQYEAGFNGEADFGFAMLGIGLFEYHLGDASATFNVGLTSQEFAMQGVYEPTETSQPVWLPVRPSPQPYDKVVANMFVDGNGGFEMQLRGQFESDWPEAKLYGSMTQTVNGLTMTGRIDDDVNPIDVTAKTNGSTFEATVKYTVDMNANLQQRALDNMDSVIAKVQQKKDEYTSAYADLQFSISLEGLRDQIPVIADNAISNLNTIPGTVYSDVYNSVKNYINNGKYCVTKYGPCYAYSDYVNATSTARSAATSASNSAKTEIAPYITRLQSMKQYAGMADDATVRAVLKSALMDVYNNQTINKTVSYKYKKTIDYGVGSFTINKTFKDTINQKMIQPNLAATILTAANNVDKIPAAESIVINIGNVLDSLPTEDAVNKAKQEVKSGVKQVPVFEGAGYSITKDGQRIGYIILSGNKEEIQFNPLDSSTVADNILNYITRGLIGE